MVNFGLNSASILGIFLAVAGAGLYFMRTIRPELSRDHDIFFAAVGLVCGAILLWSGWRLDPILQLSQFLLTGSAIFFAFEAIRLRGIATEQARRSTPIVDDDRPVSRVYREAKLDDRDYYEDPPYPKKRLIGTREARPSRRSDYEAEDRRPTPSNRRNRDSYSDPYEDRNRPPRRTRPSSPTLERYGETYEDWEATNRAGYEEPPTPSSRPRRPRPTPETDVPPSRPSRSRRERPRRDYGEREENIEATPVDYVDYQPVEDIDAPKDVAERFGTSYDDSEEDIYEEEMVDEGAVYEDEYDRDEPEPEDDRERDRPRPNSFDY
ncbi:MAG: Ycf66 family protein [Jaaginema sp. PMC 1079.18]|nr:Ycf66 family protein [Jaaginema sp. PMC 1080.18]MEC4852721.1 Ycf66 family protein [Jaaginema sp. PMC 1079.18]MEC4867024.1 Ycf66 family protein [Jaaginema sp. PMC 1078.18]